MRICADACFLVSAYDETEGNHRQARDCLVAQIEKGPHVLLIPWPVMYESISTRMVKDRRRMAWIETHLKFLRRRAKIGFIDETRFREEALRKCYIGGEEFPYRALRLVDAIICEMLLDRDLGLRALATFNLRDFEYFCVQRKKAIFPAKTA